MRLFEPERRFTATIPIARPVGVGQVFVATGVRDMPAGISQDEFAFLAAKAGVTLTEAQSAALMAVYPMISAMTERNRSTRGRQAEPGLIFVPGEGGPA